MKSIRTLVVLSLVLALLAPARAPADTVPEPESESILSPILSPVNLRLMGVLEFAFIASDSKYSHKFPGAFRRPFPSRSDAEARSTVTFGFDEFTLVFDGSFQKAQAGFHGAVLITGSGSEPDTFSTPALLEGWGYYKLKLIQFTAGRVRNPFGGLFADLPEYHLSAIDYRRFRGDGLRLDADLPAGVFQFTPSVAAFYRNREDAMPLISARLGLAVQLKGFGLLSLGGSFQYGPDTFAVVSSPRASYWDVDGRHEINAFNAVYNARRMDFGVDLSLIWRHAEGSFFRDTELHAEWNQGKLDDSAYVDEDNPQNNQNPDPPFGERKPMGWWVQFSQGLDIGPGGAVFCAFGYIDRKVEPQNAWGIGEQGILKEYVFGYRQSLARGLNLDLEVWITDDDKRLDAQGVPDFNNDGTSDLVLGNFVKLRLQVIF